MGPITFAVCAHKEGMLLMNQENLTMLNTSNARGLLTSLLVLACVAAPFATPNAQTQTKPREKMHKVTDVLSQMAETGDLGPVIFLRDQANQNPATVDSLVTGLERLIFTGKTMRGRSSAAITLAQAGTGEVPLPGIVNRLAEAYRKSADPEVRGAIITAMIKQRDRVSAIKFLSAVAVEDSEHQDFSGASWGAVTTLSHMSGAGVAALKQLHDRRAITDPRAQGYTDWWFGERLRKQPM